MAFDPPKVFTCRASVYDGLPPAVVHDSIPAISPGLTWTGWLRDGEPVELCVVDDEEGSAGWWDWYDPVCLAANNPHLTYGGKVSVWVRKLGDDWWYESDNMAMARVSQC